MDQTGKMMRHEIKYLLSYPQMTVLRQRLKAVMKQDEFMKDNKDYFIRSLYLDDSRNTAYWDKIAGVRDRKKYRIRVYNDDSDVIKLECKEKLGNRIHKESVLIDEECCKDIIHGDYEGLRKREEALCKEVYTLSHSSGFHNSVIVDYDREVYVHPVSNVRITFDKNLHAGGLESFQIFREDLITLPVYSDQSVILEVKYDEVLPAYVGTVLGSVNLGAAVSASKYCVCKDVLEQIKRV